MLDFEPGEPQIKPQDPLTERITQLEGKAGEPMMARFVPNEPDLRPISIFRAPKVEDVYDDGTGRMRGNTTYHCLVPGAEPGTAKLFAITVRAKLKPGNRETDGIGTAQHVHLPVLHRLMQAALKNPDGGYNDDFQVGFKDWNNGALSLGIYDPQDTRGHRMTRHISITSEVDPKDVSDAIMRSKDDAERVAEEKRQAAAAEEERRRAEEARAAAEAEKNVDEGPSDEEKIQDILDNLKDL